MQVLLASAPHADTFGYSMPPPGLLRLGGALERAGVDVQLEDLTYRLGAGQLDAGDALGESATRLLRRFPEPEWFGLSVMGATLPIALVIMRRLRSAWPAAQFVLGGARCGTAPMFESSSASPTSISSCAGRRRSRFPNSSAAPGPPGTSTG